MAEKINELEIVRCRNCKHFQSNVWGKLNEIPIIVAHEICDFWGGGCKTKPDGFCFAGEEISCQR